MTDTQWFVVQSNIKSEEKAAGNIAAAGEYQEAGRRK